MTACKSNHAQGSAKNRIVGMVFWKTEADAIASIEGFLHRRRPKLMHCIVGQPTAETLEVVLRA